MGLISKIVKMKWSSNNQKHYEEKGYKFTKCRYEFEVKVEDLTNGSNAQVEVKCDCPECKDPYLKPMKWSNYIINVHEDGKYYCRKCAMKIFGTEKCKKKALKKSKSFEQWCYDNLEKEEADSIMDRWDIEKNGCLPSEICYSSNGFNNKGYWFKCLKHQRHRSEQKSINKFATRRGNELSCNQCNSFGQWLLDNLGKGAIKKYWSDKNTINPFEISYGSKSKVFINCLEVDYHESYEVSPNDFSKGVRCSYCKGMKVHPLDSIGQYIVNKFGEEFLNKVWSQKNKKSPFEYMKGSNKKVWWMCPDREHKDFLRSIINSNIYDFRCPECQFSKGEKRTEEYLINNNIEYISQKEFDGLLGVGNKNLRYDFYLMEYNTLIEYQGGQHEKFTKGIHETIEDFKKQQEHDRRKREYAKENNMKLLEIWYWDFDNIEQILTEELAKYNLINISQTQSA